MRKKALNVILFLAVVIAAVGMTLYVGRGAASILVYNFCFLGIMVIAYAVGMFGGMFRMSLKLVRVLLSTKATMLLLLQLVLLFMNHSRQLRHLRQRVLM